MPWTEAEPTLRKLAQFPKRYLDAETHQRIHDHIRSEERKQLLRKKRFTRIRWSAFASLVLMIVLLTTSLFVTESGRDLAWNAWVKLNGNAVSLEDGVILKFREHTITEADFVNVIRGTWLEAELKTIIVYEEAIAKGYKADMQRVETALIEQKVYYQDNEQAKAGMQEALQRGFITEEEFWQKKRESLIREDVVHQYFVQLFGTPYFTEQPLPRKGTFYYEQYVTNTNAYKDLCFKKYQDEVIFNKEYDYEFHWQDFIENSLGTAYQDRDVLISYQGKPLLTTSSPLFNPTNITTQELQQRIGLELFYLEAAAKHYRPKKSDLDTLDEMQKQYNEDLQIREQIQQEMKAKGLTEEEYWENSRRFREFESVVKQYIKFLYPDTMRMSEAELEKALALITNEYFQRAKPVLVFNDRVIKQYKWDVDTLTTIGNDIMENYVIAEFREFPLLALELGRNRFNKESFDITLSFWIIYELAKEDGYEIDQNAVDVKIKEINEIFKRDDHDRILVGEFMRNNSITKEYMDQHIRKIAEIEFIYWGLIPDYVDSPKYADLSRFGSWKEALTWHRAEYKELYDEVVYNSDYPLVD